MTTKQRVQSLLEQYAETRGSDAKFFAKYTELYQPQYIKVGMDGRKYLVVALEDLKFLEILNHTILATRQTIQKKMSWLRDEMMWAVRHNKGERDKFKY